MLSQNLHVTEAIMRLKLSKRLARANTQIQLLKQKIRDLTLRYKKAKRCNDRTFLQSLALRLDVTEGMRNAMYSYARDLADQLSDVIWEEIREIIIISVDFDNEDNDSLYDGDDDVDDDAEDELLVFDGRT